MIEAKNEAETILTAVEKGRSHAAWQMLSSDEIEKIEQGDELSEGSDDEWKRLQGDSAGD